MGTEICQLGGYGFQGVTLGVDGLCKEGTEERGLGATNSGRKVRANVRKLAERKTAHNVCIRELLQEIDAHGKADRHMKPCLLYTSPSPRDLSTSRMPSSA